jgi:surfactin synthase thioesterase subunit
MVFGHSMGALLAFEFVRELRRVGAPPPEHLFLSGRPAPHLRSRIPRLHDLPEPEFKRHLGLLNGTPAKVLEDLELMELLMPMLRADFSICETYACAPEEPISVPITAFGGIMDAHTRREDLEAWRSYTLGAFDVRMFSGGHFYIHSMRSSLVSAVLEVASAYISNTESPNLLQRIARNDM